VQNIDPDTLIDGRYRVRSRLGSGGMADVYCATDQQLGRTVALKLLYRRFAEDEEFVERFRREASSAAGLQHPNVVSIFDRGEWDGTYYIAMEYLEGASLKDLVREQGPLDPGRAVELIVQVLKAARFAHRRGIIHRDFKPHNVIVDAEGRAKVTDFGIAKAGASDMTETGAIMGTAQYLSPEQAQGHAVTAQSDLYSIGILLYELLAALVLAGVAAGAYFGLRADRIEVPDVVKNRSGVAQARLANAGFVVNTQQARSETVPEDIVFRQDPEPGQRAEEGATVTIVVSAGPGDATVPAVERLTLRSAERRLERAGFNANVRREASTTVPEGRVIESAPPEGSRLQKGRDVVLVVSSGPEQVEVPDVVGESRQEAESTLEAAGFETRVTEQESEEEEPGTVLAQRPGAGESADEGAAIRLTVAARPALVEVPDVVGSTQAGATAALQDAGFAVRVRRERVDTPDEDGDVIEQNPSSGSRRERGSTVFVTVGTFAPPEEDETPTPTPTPTATP